MATTRKREVIYVLEAVRTRNRSIRKPMGVYTRYAGAASDGQAINAAPGWHYHISRHVIGRAHQYTPA